VARFDEVVQSQFGLLTRDQGLEFFGRRGFDRRVRRGEFIRVARGLYRVAGSPVTAEQRLFLATLAYSGVASHRAAAALRGFQRYVDVPPEVTVARRPGGKGERAFGEHVRLHRTNCLPTSHIELVRGIPTTTAARTICDLSSLLSTPSLGRLLDDAKRRSLVTYEAVAACRDDIRSRGRRRTTVIDELLEFPWIGFNPGESPPELEVRTWLEDAGIYPVAQHR